MRNWLIHISCSGKPMGPPILVSGWEVLARLACVREHTDALMWEAHAVPVIERTTTYDRDL